MFTIFKSEQDRFLDKAWAIVPKINALEPVMQALADTDFPQKTAELKDRLVKGETLESLLPEAFALVREASRRTLGQRHYDVQMVGGIALSEKRIAEMRTGEGKTLVATLPVYLNALAGRGVHVITVNDYLSRRDAAWMGQVYAFLGMTTGVINSQQTSYLYDPSHKDKKDDELRDEVGSYRVIYEFLRPVSRREAYAADITYGTNNEYGFDYLRDNLVGSKEQLVQRGHAYAIVDEIDSILIDEARTPLIISSESGESEDFYVRFAEIARQLTKGDDYAVDEKLKAITMTDMGITKAESLLGIDNIYTEKGIKYVHHLETAVRARALYERDRDYVVTNDEVVIVDPFTGRMQPGRRWSEGLHQAVEAKEAVKIQKETKAVASITFQNYFRFYEKLAGMTGTAMTSKEEFYKVYGLDVIPVPTHRTVARKDHTDLIYQTEKAKFRAIAEKAKELQEKGQPVLIGTVSIEKNELLSAHLTSAGVRHTVLNAKNHEKEGEIIASAGKRGAVTLATNMAGRGVDIKLGGPDATKEEAEAVKALGGLFVIGSERHEARRIDNQLRGRAGRQGDPGATQFYVSLEDDLMRIFGSDRMKNMMGKLGIPEDQPIQNSFISRSIESAQTKIEGFHFDARQNTLQYDDVMNRHRTAIYERRKAMLFSEKDKIESYLAELIAGNETLEKTIAERRAAVGDEAFLEAVRRIMLYTTDILWVEHLETMEYSRSSVNLRAYGQREPLVEYKKEALRLFREMEQAFREQSLTLITTISADATRAPVEVPAERIIIASHAEADSISGNKESPQVPAVQSTDTNNVPKVGRNDLCPCGSGKKYKKCHGA